MEDDNKFDNDGRSTGWFVGIVVALALLAIGYLLAFAANGVPTP